MVTRSDLSLIAVRVVALYLIAEGITMLPALSPVWFGEMYEESGLRWSYTATIAFTILGGMVLFFLSRPFARLVMPNGPQPDEPPANLSGIQSVALSTIGLFLIVLNLPNLLAAIVQFKRESVSRPYRPQNWYMDPFIVAQLAKVALGVLLCTGPSYWTRLVKKFRDLGYAKQEP